jgi:hypothetical protein
VHPCHDQALMRGVSVLHTPSRGQKVVCQYRCSQEYRKLKGDGILVILGIVSQAVSSLIYQCYVGTGTFASSHNAHLVNTQQNIPSLPESL